MEWSLVAPGKSGVGKTLSGLEGRVLSVNNALAVPYNFLLDRVSPRGAYGVYLTRESRAGSFKSQFHTGFNRFSSIVGETGDNYVIEVYGRTGLRENGLLYKGGLIEFGYPTTACALCFLRMIGAEKIHLYGCEHADSTGQGYRRGTTESCYNNEIKDSSYFVNLSEKKQDLIEACKIATNNGAEIVSHSEGLEESQWTSS
ncbi:MAG: hypothetical protein K9L56_14205 [Clostridiales bacterium]|nr:hypothetical protein [Clostridiales bacterium]